MIIVGSTAHHHIGHHLFQAAERMELNVKIIDMRLALQGHSLFRRISWHLFDHRPLNIRKFSNFVFDVCEEFEPHYILTTGTLPMTNSVLQRIGKAVNLLNYMTDDPWNPSRRSERLFENLSFYHLVLTPRRSNINDLKELGCVVEYVKFGYEPDIHFSEAPPEHLSDKFECDVMFYGGADKDRLPMAKAMIEAGFNVHLYGGYWNRDRTTRPFHRGTALGADLRWAVSGAKVCLCPVRRMNRDGHVMRTFEVPAMGGCMLAEDTEEHREIFGEEGKNVLYFRDDGDMIDKIRILLNDETLRLTLAKQAHHHITTGPNTYYDRLVEMLGYAERLKTK